MYRDDEAFGSVGSLQDAQRGMQGFLVNSEVTEMPKGKLNAVDLGALSLHLHP